MKHHNMYTIIQFYSPSDVANEKEERNNNMQTIIQFYSPADVDDRVDREREKK